MVGGDVATPLLMSLLAGFSTTLGAGVVFLMPGKNVPPSHLAFYLALSAGVMLAVSILEFWVPGIEGKRDLFQVFAYSSIGAVLFYFITKLLPEIDYAESISQSQDGAAYGTLQQAAKSSKEQDCESAEIKKGQAKSLRLAFVLMALLTAHNFPEGFAVAMSAIHSTRMGLVVMFAIAIHNIPEGIAIAIPVFNATGSHWRALWMAFLSGMAEPVGAVVAVAFAHAFGERFDEAMLENLLCVVGGMMSAVSILELIPEAMQQRKPLACWTGLIFGFVMMWSSIKIGA